MSQQPILRLSLPRNSSEENHVHTARERIFSATLRSDGEPRKISPQKLFADLLKRQARRIMADVTECPSHLLPVNLARLDDLRDTINAALSYGFVDYNESLPSGAALQYASTLNDYLAAIHITRKEHRAPAFVNQRDQDIADIKRMFGLLAGLLSTHPLSEEIIELSGTETEVEP